MNRESSNKNINSLYKSLESSRFNRTMGNPIVSQKSKARYQNLGENEDDSVVPLRVANRETFDKRFTEAMILQAHGQSKQVNASQGYLSSRLKQNS